MPAAAKIASITGDIAGAVAGVATTVDGVSVGEVTDTFTVGNELLADGMGITVPPLDATGACVGPVTDAGAVCTGGAMTGVGVTGAVIGVSTGITGAGPCEGAGAGAGVGTGEAIKVVVG
jgi:hypothetical protein